MTDKDERILGTLVIAAKQGSLRRREFVQRATALGFSASVVATAVTALFGPNAQAEAEPSSRRADGTIVRIFPPLEGLPGNMLVEFTLHRQFPDSPRILTRGWHFALAVRSENLPEGVRAPTEVRWSGDGVTFSPPTTALYQGGPVSMANRKSCAEARFQRPGEVALRAVVTIAGRIFSQTYSFVAEDATRVARVGDLATCEEDAHGCPACPHPVQGPLIMGSPDFYLDGKPVARVGDRGVHAACCGANRYEVTEGYNEVLINGKPVAVKGSRTRHCGGTGALS